MKYYSVTYSNSLSHHGILGQKWGKKNGPPYPLDAGDHSARERKAGWRKSLRDRRKKGHLGNYGYSDDEIKNARKKYVEDSRNREKTETTSSIGQTKGYWKNAPKQTVAQRMYDDEKSAYKKEYGFKLTDKQKKYLKIGAAVAVTGLAVYGAYKLSSATGNVDNITDTVKKAADVFVNNSGLADTIVHHLNEAPNFVKGVTVEEDIRKLSDLEIKAFQAYSVPHYYKEVNGIADTLLDHDYSPEWLNGVDPIAKSIAENIESAMKKLTIRRDVDVQRGIDESACRQILGDGLFNELSLLRMQSRKSGQNITGVEISNLKKTRINSRGFTSTAVGFNMNMNGKTVRRGSVADYFSGKDGIIFEARAKAGLHGVEMSSMSELDAEREVLFARNTSMVPTGTVDIVNGIIHVYVDLIQD